MLIVRQYDKSKINPLRLKLLEGDYLDHTKHDVAKNLIQGIQFDGNGNIVGYWLFKSHPGDLSSQSTLVNASEVIHLYRAKRPGQSRGITWFETVIKDLRMLSDFEDALLQKQIVSNAFCGFIYSNEAYNRNSTTTTTATMEPGSLVTLEPGKQIEFANPPPPSAPDSFLNHILMSIAAGVGIPYEILTRQSI